VRVSPDLSRKGQLKMRALAEDIRGYAERCTRVRGQVAPGPTVEFEHLDVVVNQLDRTLVAIRTLDHEVFERSGGSAYRTARSSSREGRVVTAVAAVRNAGVHSAVVIDPDVRRAIGPIAHNTFIIFPRWKQRIGLPQGTFLRQSQKPDKARAAAYDADVAGRLVLDTLFDAFAFFDRCDSSLVTRVDNQIEGFPIPPLPVASGYYRLHPDWPPHETAEDENTGRG
jgi:hypothetical protein